MPRKLLLKILCLGLSIFTSVNCGLFSWIQAQYEQNPTKTIIASVITLATAGYLT